MTKQAEAGKGSKPRQQQDNEAFASGWDRIFGGNKRKEIEMTATLREQIVEWLGSDVGEQLEDIPGNDWYANQLDIRELVHPKTGLKSVTVYKVRDIDQAIIENHLLVLVNAVGGSEGEGETVERVIGAYPILSRMEYAHTEVTFDLDLDSARFFKINGCYQSYDGITWDDASDLKEVYPELVQVIRYK